MKFMIKPNGINFKQEPITLSVQLPYSVYETAFSQVGLFLDQPFPGISLRFFRSDLFTSFGFS